MSTVKEWMTKELIGELQIISAVLFFGVSFVYQRYAMTHTHVGPITYNACRFVISTFLLVVLKPYAQKTFHTEIVQKVDESVSELDRNTSALKELWFWGVLCGLSGFGGSILQQIGIVTVTAGKTGFITGMFVIFVPIVEWLTPGFGVSLNYKTWIAALVSLFGLYLLSGCLGSDRCFGGAVGSGEVIVFVSMLCWVFGIMWSDIGSKRVDVISLTTVDFLVVTVLTIVFALVFEPQFFVYPFTEIRSCYVPILVVGVTEALAFSLSTLGECDWNMVDASLFDLYVTQFAGQMYSSPSRASVLFSMESVSCAVLSYFFLGEQMTYMEIIGEIC